MSYLSSAVSGAIPAVFGNGLLGACVTGLVRVPSFMASCTAVLMAGELVIRGLSGVLAQAGFEAKGDTIVGKVAAQVANIRPYQATPVKELIIRTVALAAIGIVGSEFARIAGGAAPSIYNTVLSVMGPIRIDAGSYLQGIRPVLSTLGF